MVLTKTNETPNKSIKSVQTETAKMFSITTQTLCLIINKTIQTDLINLVNKRSQTGSEEKTLGFPKFLSLIQNVYFPMAKIYLPACIPRWRHS